MRAEMKLARRFLGMVLMAGAIAACDDDPVGPEEPEIDAVRLTLGAQTVTITSLNTTGTVTIPVGTTAISAVFLDADGDVLHLGSEFELRVTPAASGAVTFTRTGAFAGSLQATAAGTTTMQIQAFHLEENHPDFGPFTVTVIVQ